MSNPLLEQTGLPAFSRITPEHVEPAIDHLLADWSSLVEPIEEWDEQLNRAWSPVSHLNAVVNSDDLRAAYNACLPKLSDYATEMGHNEKLFAAYKSVAAQPGQLASGTGWRVSQLSTETVSVPVIAPAVTNAIYAATGILNVEIFTKTQEFFSTKVSILVTLILSLGFT